MTETILTNEPIVRLSFFFGVLGVMIMWESIAPRRARSFSRWTRWPSNFGIVALNTVLLRVLSPMAAVGVALAAEAQGWGLLNAAALPEGLSIIVAVAALDLTVYLQHVMFHAVPALWRLHRMHHADLDFDTTTGARFHPIEILLSMGLKMMVVAALGASAAAVVIFEVLLNATAMFNHGNVRLPLGLDRVLRWIVVTPDMHRVHHSVAPQETNSNFGFNLPWWDRAFGTYCAQPSAGHEAMIIGLDQFREPRDLRLDQMLIQPWRGAKNNYSINRRD